MSSGLKLGLWDRSRQTNGGISPYYYKENEQHSNDIIPIMEMNKADQYFMSDSHQEDQSVTQKTQLKQRSMLNT